MNFELKILNPEKAFNQQMMSQQMTQQIQKQSWLGKDTINI